MTPATRLIEAVRHWHDILLYHIERNTPGIGIRPEERAMWDAIEALSGARALYPSAHALGDRVSVVYPDERPGFTGVVVGVEFHTDGVDYRVKGDADPDYTVVEAGFVRAAPRTLPLYRAPGVSGGPDWTVEDVVVGEPSSEADAVAFVPLDRRMTWTNPPTVPVIESPHTTGAFLINTASPVVQQAAMEAIASASPSWFPMDGRTAHPRVAAQMHDMAVATGRVPAEAPTDVSAIPKRTGAPKNEYVCLLLGGNPLTRCVLASGHGGACVAEKDQRVTREQLPYPSPGEPFDYDSLTDDEKASLRKTPRSELDSHADPGWVSVGPGREITRTNTLVIPGRTRVTTHTDEHGVKTTETVDLRDPDDLHARFAEALGAEWKTLTGDARHEWLAAFERAAEIAGEVWGKKRTLDVYANGRLLTLDITGEGALRVETIGLNNVSVGWMKR